MKVPLKRTLAMVALLGQASLVTACSYDEAGPVSSEPTAEARAQLTGEQMFRGIFFGEGPVGAMFAEVWEGRSATDRADNPETARLIREIQDDAVSHIRTVDPDFFAHFAAQVRSGDHLQTQSALREGATLLGEAVQANPTYAQLATAVEPAAGFYLYVETAVAAVLVLVVFLIDFSPNLTLPNQPLIDGDSSLQSDELVQLTVEALGT